MCALILQRIKKEESGRIEHKKQIEKKKKRFQQDVHPYVFLDLKLLG